MEIFLFSDPDFAPARALIGRIGALTMNLL